MTKKYIRIAELIYKDKIGELTEQEKNELLVWLEESDFNRQIFDELAKGSSLSRSYATITAARAGANAVSFFHFPMVMYHRLS